jgi:Alginate lyase
MVVRLFALFFFALVTAAQAQPLLVSDSELAGLKANKKVMRSVLRKCDAELALPTHAIADFAPKPHYTAQGANPDDDQAKALTGDIRRAYRAALCFRISGKQAYAHHAQIIADAWANTMKSASNAQGRADINFNVSQLVVAASWVQKDWNSNGFSNWLKTVIAPLSLSAEPNNRGNWGNLQDITIAAFTEDTAKFAAAYGRWQQLMVAAIQDDGTMPLEICRSNSSNHCGGPDKGVNGLGYTHYALLPAVLAAKIQIERDVQIGMSPGGTKIDMAVAKAMAFTAHPETFPYYAANHGKLNQLDHCGYFALWLLYVDDNNGQSAIASGTCKSDIWMLQKIFGK